MMKHSATSMGKDTIPLKLDLTVPHIRIGTTPLTGHHTHPNMLPRRRAHRIVWTSHHALRYTITMKA